MKTRDPYANRCKRQAAFLRRLANLLDDYEAVLQIDQPAHRQRYGDADPIIDVSAAGAWAGDVREVTAASCRALAAKRLAEGSEA